MQIATTSILGDFIGWGTARGLGVPGTDCPDDYSPHWKVYIDGSKFGDYFCRQQYGEVLGTATDQLFTLRFGDCNGNERWRAFLNGVRKTCQIIDAETPDNVFVGGEVKGYSIDLHIDIHYGSLKRYYSPTDYWYAWTTGNADQVCAEDPYYQVTIIAADDVWVEQTP